MFGHGTEPLLSHISNSPYFVGGGVIGLTIGGSGEGGDQLVIGFGILTTGTFSSPINIRLCKPRVEQSKLCQDMTPEERRQNPCCNIVSDIPKSAWCKNFHEWPVLFQRIACGAINLCEVAAIELGTPVGLAAALCAFVRKHNCCPAGPPPPPPPPGDPYDFDNRVADYSGNSPVPPWYLIHKRSKPGCASCETQFTDEEELI